MTTGQSSTTVIGVGSPYRSDDGVGIAVVRRIREQNPPGFTVLEASGEGAELLEAWKGATVVILVDAVHSGSAPPGTIHRLDVHSQPVPSRFFHYSSHAFSVAEAVELARALNRLPPYLIIYGIEGKNFSAGEALSIEVEQAAANVIAQMLKDARALAGEGILCTNSPSSTT